MTASPSLGAALFVLISTTALLAADCYEIPPDLIYNKFSEKILKQVLVSINEKLQGKYLIFDVPRAQSKLSDAVIYEYDLVVSPHACEMENGGRSVTFASCKQVGLNFQSCKAVIIFSPWNGVENQLTIERLSCDTVRPSLPQNPYFLGYSLPHNANELFVAFQSKHRRFYSRQEFKKRLNIFKKNLLKVQLLQDLDSSAKYGITRFADMDVDEFRKTHTTMKTSNELMNGTERIFLKDVFEIPTSFDWRTKGAVTEVKDQGSCGSCWAFGTVGNIETKWFLKTGALVSLSEQQLLDCDQKDEACNGGLPEWAFPQIIQMGGLMSEKDYPYEAHKENSCHLVKNNVSAKIDGWAQLPKDEKKLAAWLVENGTITVGINANFLQFYMGGISHPPHFLCSDEGLDHAVLLVGYGVSSFLRRPFWVIKNSWGSGWGESGYFRLYRGDGTCGINADATTSIIY